MTNSQKIVLTGATGLIGPLLCKRLLTQGYQLVILSRNPATARAAIPGATEYLPWSPTDASAATTAVDGARAVFHLAGAPIAAHRWTEDYKREILESRTFGTRSIVQAISQASSKPQVLISMSGIDYYGARDDTPLDENQPPGSGFLSKVCIEWEREALRAEALGVRTAIIRTGLVLAKQGGALAPLLQQFQLFAGGPVLPGTQWWSWIHMEDELGLLQLALEDARVQGPLNAVAPEPVRNRDFAATLGRVLRRPSWAPVPLFALELVLGEMAGPLLVEKQRVIPRKALDLGYQFRFAALEPALRDTLKG